MSRQKFDQLSLYAGLDITYSTADQREGPINQAISRLFTRAENTLTRLEPKERIIAGNYQKIKK